MDFYVRPMHSEDVPQVTQIEREAFATTWPPTAFRRELGNRMSRYLVVSAEADGYKLGESGPVLQSLVPPAAWVQRMVEGVKNLFGVPPEIINLEQEFVAGYVGIWFIVDEAHITSIAVREPLRRTGLGELLVMASVELAMVRRAQRVTLEARISNEPAHALYEKYGFKKINIRKRYYSDNGEDAYIMTVDSILSPSYQRKFEELVTLYNRRRGEAKRILA
ncbi:MAG: ribosomal protein S18-alanine N-acetyltransferase [Chloroflexota bacterium]|nr:ribosomal protein S18-alanine N-acetyltransferase [Chloroflexota bacterium]